MLPVEEFDTLNGLLISKLEHIPKENETAVIEYQGYQFEILSIDNKKIGTLGHSYGGNTVYDKADG